MNYDPGIHQYSAEPFVRLALLAFGLIVLWLIIRSAVRSAMSGKPLIDWKRYDDWMSKN